MSYFRRAIATLLALLLLSPCCALAETYVQPTKATVNVSAEPSTGSKKVGTVKSGTAMTVLEEKSTRDGKHWYKIESGDIVGYVPGNAVEAVEAPAVDGYVKTLKPATILRGSPSTSGKKLATIDKNVPLALIAISTDKSGNTWYEVKYDDVTAYIRDDLAKRISADEAQTLLEKQAAAFSAPATEKAKSSFSGASVWIPTKGGKKYHSNASCSNMDEPRVVSIGEAERLGFTACKKCY